MSLIDSTTGLSFGTSLQFQTPIGGGGLTIIVEGGLDTPVLSLNEPPGTNPPEFLIVYGFNLDVDDEVEFQYSTASDFTGATTITNTLDAAEILAGEVTELTGELADGTWYFRTRITRDAEVSAWSNTVTDTFGGFVPTFYFLGF